MKRLAANEPRLLTRELAQRPPSNEDPVALARTAAIFRAARARRLAREADEAERREAS